MLYGLAFVLAAPLCAQGVLYSPPHLDSKTEGGRYAYYFYRYPGGRSQWADGENRGKVAVITAISTRLDYRSYSTFTGPGRKWTNVKVMFGEGDISKFSTTFSSNMTTTPTTVYNAAWSVPTVATGYPSTSPAPWGGTNGEYTLPFSTTWLYTGKGDIIQDWTYAGGTLDNNVTWSSSSSRTYYLDSYIYTSPYSSVGSTYSFIPTTRLNNNSTGVTGRCNDSEHGTRTTGAYNYLYATAYGKQYPITNYRGRLLFYTVSYYTGYENPLIHAIAFANDTKGIDLNTGCNKLHLKGPMLLRPRVSLPSSYSSSGYSGYRFDLVPWKNVFAGLQLTLQTAWADSSTNNLNLSQARQAILPSMLPEKEQQRSYTYHYNGATATTGFGPYGGSTYYYNPAFAYTTK